MTYATRKYGNVKVQEGAYVFDSKAESRRYGELKLLLLGGEIINLEVHPKFELWVNDSVVGKYIADFSYYDRQGKKRTVEDVKGVRTAVYRLKAKMVKAQYGITITEIEA